MKNKIRKIINNLKEELEKSPYKFNSEADFQFYLFEKLKEDKKVSIFIDKKFEVDLWHVEYPAILINKKKKIEKFGRYDIAKINNKNKKLLEKRIQIDHCETDLAIELKLLWNKSLKFSIEKMSVDANYFIDDKKYEYFIPKEGYVICINIDRKAKSDINNNEFEDLEKIKKDVKKDCDLTFFYIEVSRNKYNKVLIREI